MEEEEDQHIKATNLNTVSSSPSRGTDRRNIAAAAAGDGAPPPMERTPASPPPPRSADLARQWKSSACIIGSGFAKTAAVSGAMADLAVYMIKGYNVGRIAAAEATGVINGCVSLSPIVFGAVADSLGCFAVIATTTAASLLGFVLFTLTAILTSLRPPPCSPASGSPCPAATGGQLFVLYLSVAMVAAGVGGTRYNLAAMGAFQLDNNLARESFFNWFLIGTYSSTVAGMVGVVYLLDTAGWGWGFAVCAALTTVGLAAFLLGGAYYRPHRPSSGPLASLFRDVVLSKKAAVATAEYLPLDDGGGEGGDSRWNDLAVAACVLPLISAVVLLSTTISTLTNLTTLQALIMDRWVGGATGFFIPAGSATVFTYASAAVAITVLDRVVFPVWSCTPLQRIAVGHVVNAAAMAGAAAVESRRRILATTSSEPAMSVLWLAPPLAIVGLGEAFYFPGVIALCYQEFPAPLRCTAASMAALAGGLGYYLSAGIIAVAGRLPGWLEDDLDRSRLDRVYWALSAIGGLNFCYFLLCWKLFRRRHAR